MLKFRALCGFMYGWVGNTKKLMGPKGFFWVIDENKKNLRRIV